VLGSGGGPRRALELFDEDPFLIVNGDTLADVDLEALARAHRASGAQVTLALTPHREPMRYGGVRLDGTGRVAGFVKKGEAAGGESFHFVGLQIASAAVFHDVPLNEPASTIGGIYDRLIVERPGSVHGAVIDAAFRDVGTIADYWHTSLELADASPAEAWRGRGVSISPSAQVRRSFLWDEVEIGDDCVVDECIVTDGVRLPAGSRYRRMVLTASPDGVQETPIVL
jgi:NDP-sugar pyrophosphorylase family protein